MIIGVGNDHAAVSLKKAVIAHLTEMGHECIDYGAQEGEAVDYPVPGRAVAEAVQRGEADKGILICGTGIGIGISANKVPGIRCAICSDTFSAAMCVEHNDCNCIAFGARVVGEGLALKIVDAYLSASFQGGRHERRVGLISQIEAAYSAGGEVS
ncbi:MAG: ribose 5-phosphate isomerase B [Lachnospiraceae bacterium]|nr:ribose 5-phosphate isomerase B [Lachnospiraceae bacterium]